VEKQTNSLADSFGRGDDKVIDAIGYLQQLGLEIGGHHDF